MVTQEPPLTMLEQTTALPPDIPNGLNVLLIGSGGREHAIAQALAESPFQPKLFFAPGNPGMETLGQRLEIEATDVQGLLIHAKRSGIDLVVVGPEAPLTLGLVDALAKEGIPVFGPSQAAARLEGSKQFAKTMMQAAGIPTAGHHFCTTLADALAALNDFQPPYVIKEDGLAAGKGVTIAQNRAEAEQAIETAMQKKMPVVIEEFMAGEELSVLAFCDGQHALPLVSAQDFKRVGEGHTGPNTGGMGAYAPVPFVTPSLMAQIQAEVLNPLVAAMARQGTPYRGILYAGLMIGPDGTPRVVEFNVRFGDPETQVVLPLLEEDLLALMWASAHGNLSAYAATGLRCKRYGAAVTVVAASQGYPGPYTTGMPITLPEHSPKSVRLTHAGTRRLPSGQLVTSGGRVLTVTGLGDSLTDARRLAYEALAHVRFEGLYYRRDIAQQASQTETVPAV
ncbi:MAG: phosphoribosylamine--glycine ligase [Candidatus Melainabacteria bacterium]|nr:phosphoribosylamine--glycine ligase [Candidatus Melainabacteria bacterium]